MKSWSKSLGGIVATLEWSAFKNKSVRNSSERFPLCGSRSRATCYTLTLYLDIRRFSQEIGVTRKHPLGMVPIPKLGCIRRL
jgi:hypothetical protein